MAEPSDAPVATGTAAPAASDGVAGDATDVRGGELMPFDDGSMTADKAQSSAMGLVINYAEPLLAAGAAVFGLGLVVLPLLARLNALDQEQAFAYGPHGETNPRQPLRLFTEAELRQRLGALDADYVAREITMSAEELEEHITNSDMQTTDDEVSKIQKWRDTANAHLKSLQKRSALAFLGLPPEASDSDINKMYKKMALELHPDKGGDPEKFQELQEMKERLNELEKEENGEKKDDEDPEDEEARRAKEKEKEEEQEREKLPPSERIRKLRTDVHENTVRLWDRAKKSKDEITGDKAIKSNSQPAVNILQLFVDRFVNSEIKTLRHDDVKGAEAKLRKFLKQGAEIIAVAALQDVQTTLSTIAMHFNYKLVARSGSPDIKNKCAALLEAIADVPTQAEAFLRRVEDRLADQRDGEKRRKEERAKAQKEREARGDFSGEAGAAPSPSAPSAPGASASSSSAPPKAAPAAKSVGASGAPDPFGDFDFGGKENMRKPDRPAAAALPTDVVARKREDDRSAIAAAVAQPHRTGWDPNFDHPYAGALKSNGTGIYCRPCQRWIVTYEYNVEVFHTHVERVHPKPPLGWP